LGWVFYKDVAPLALDFRFGRDIELVADSAIGAKYL
jgi:hypothetical protein